jgi:hypothetical protein
MIYRNHAEDQHQLVYLIDLVLGVSPYDSFPQSAVKTLHECKKIKKTDRSIFSLLFAQAAFPEADAVPVSQPLRVAAHDRGGSMASKSSTSRHILIDTVLFLFALALPGSQSAVAKSEETG